MISSKSTERRILTIEEKMKSIERNIENWEAGITGDNLFARNIRSIIRDE